MAESRSSRARLAFIVLLIANVLLLAYWTLASESRSTVAARINELQINAGRIRLIGAASRGPGSETPKAACLEWGPFRADDAPRAEIALASLALRNAPVQRTIGEAGGVKRIAYFIRDPEQGTIARITDLQRNFPEAQLRAGPCPS